MKKLLAICLAACLLLAVPAFAVSAASTAPEGGIAALKFKGQTIRFTGTPFVEAMDALFMEEGVDILLSGCPVLRASGDPVEISDLDTKLGDYAATVNADLNTLFAGATPPAPTFAFTADDTYTAVLCGFWQAALFESESAVPSLAALEITREKLAKLDTLSKVFAFFTTAGGAIDPRLIEAYEYGMTYGEIEAKTLPLSLELKYGVVLQDGFMPDYGMYSDSFPYYIEYVGDVANGLTMELLEIEGENYAFAAAVNHTGSKALPDCVLSPLATDGFPVPDEALAEWHATDFKQGDTIPLKVGYNHVTLVSYTEASIDNPYFYSFVVFVPEPSAVVPQSIPGQGQTRPQGQSPKTGDADTVALTALAVLSLAGLATAVTLRKKNQA